MGGSLRSWKHIDIGYYLLLISVNWFTGHDNSLEDLIRHGPLEGRLYLLRYSISIYVRNRHSPSDGADQALPKTAYRTLGGRLALGTMPLMSIASVLVYKVYLF